MYRLQLVFLAVLIAVLLMVAPVAAQTTPPPQIQAALDMFGRYLGRTVTLFDMDRWGYTQQFYSDSSLGCPLIVNPTSFAGPVSAATVELIYQGTRYEFRVRDDLQDGFPCDPLMMAVATPGAVPIIATADPNATNCPADFAGYLVPRLIVGGQGRIGETGTANRVRSRPSRDAEQIGLIDPGTTVDILEGPSCEDATKIIWWRVSNNGLIGWTAEGIGADYFLAPVAGGTLALPQERVALNNATFGSVIPLSTVSFVGATSVSFSNDSFVVVGGEQGLLIYNLLTLQQLVLPIDIQPEAFNVAFSPDGTYLAFNDAEGKVYIVNTDTAVAITPSDLPAMQVNSLAFSSTDLLAIGTGSTAAGSPSSNAWYIYDIPNQRQLAVRPTSGVVHDVAFSADGSLFAWVDTALNIINVADGSTVITQPISNPGGGLAWRPGLPVGSPQQIAYADGNHIVLYTLGGGLEQFGDAPQFFPNIIRFSADGSLVSGMSIPQTGAPDTAVINVFDIETGLILYGTGFASGRDFAFSPDGTLIVIVTEEIVQFYGIDSDTLAVG